MQVRVLLMVATLAFLAPHALAQGEGVSYVEGGEPGIVVLLSGTDLSEADATHPIGVDPAEEVSINITLAPPPGKTWEIRETHVAVLLQGPGSTPPDALIRRSPTDTSIPPGYTVFVNRTFALESLKPLGAGLFLMRVEVLDADGAALYTREFYAHVLGNPILTVAGAVAGVATIATGYGLWQVVKDLKEAYQARERHRKKARESRAAKYAMMAVSAGDGIEGAVDIAADLDHKVDHLSKRRALAWAATGLGLGSVGVSWAQFYGLVPLDLGSTLLTGAGLAAAFLTGALLLIAMQQRVKAHLAERSRRVPVTEPEPAQIAPPPEERA